MRSASSAAAAPSSLGWVWEELAEQAGAAVAAPPHAAPVWRPPQGRREAATGPSPRRRTRRSRARPQAEETEEASSPLARAAASALRPPSGRPGAGSAACPDSPRARRRGSSARSMRFNDSRGRAHGRRPDPHPRAAVGLGRGGARGSPSEVRITVAWELSWYQWGVDLGDELRPVYRDRQGHELERARRSARQWNARRGRAAARPRRAGRASAGAARAGRAEAPGEAVVNVDGGARGNPGPAAIAAVVQDADGEVLEERGERIGERDQQRRRVPGAAARDRAGGRRSGASEIELVGDSELIVRQVKGEYKVKDATLRELHAEVRAALARLRDLVDPPRAPRARTPRPTRSSTRRSTADG